MDQVNLCAWIDRSETTLGGISQQKSKLIHAVLGQRQTAEPQEGERVPHLWHWYAFPPAVAMEELGEDGHPRLGDFMPPLRLNRRMWAGGSLEFLAPLHVGEPLKKRTRIADIAEKNGKSGEMVLVSLDHEISGTQGIAIRERQDIVYMQMPDSYRAPKAVPAPQTSDLSEDVAISTPLLFRYSSITFNAHRIHYDLAYTREVEHYPDLVVHGPLQANLLMDMATRHRGYAPSVFSYRGVHPAFAGDKIRTVAAKKSEAEWSLATVANGAHQCMQANAMWEI